VSLDLERDVLLFFEDRDRDVFVSGDRRLRRFLRKAVAPLRPSKQSVTGFEMSFILLCKALRGAGRRLHINNYRLAERNPDFPVAICGFPHILDNWRLPNPAVLGPGLFDHPKLRPALMNDPRFKSYIVLCDWNRDVFATLYDPDVLDLWFGAIDLSEWTVTDPATKTIDVLVYDKIRWNRETLVPDFRDPMLAELTRRGVTYKVLRYTKYTLREYKQFLAQSRSMIFICEHETQGMAYQEALACNVPVLAWDPGTWLDPNSRQWEDRPVPASTVPYFSPECGERFASLTDFYGAFDRFLGKLDAYEPRRWVSEHLSMRQSAELYLHAYAKAAGQVDTNRYALALRELAQNQTNRV
jgi:hypothetical protein